MTKKFITLFLFLIANIHGEPIEKLLGQALIENITADFREPTYTEGVLVTEKGGVISGPNLRIQALNICYSRHSNEGAPVCTIQAEGQLIVEFGDYRFVGESLFYDFQKKEGVIAKGRTSVEPWHFGGERIHLLSNGDYLIYNGYVTTSENLIPEWQLQAATVYVQDEHSFSATDVKLQINHYSILWVPSLKLNLNAIFDSPITYRFRWGGKQGPRFGFTYEIFSSDNWKAFFRFDYRLTRGPGGGIELKYLSPSNKTSFNSVSYVAKDSSLLHLHENWRYRFEGSYRHLIDPYHTNVLITYDKVSDIDLPSSYYDKDFEFIPAKRTQLLVKRQEDNWIGEFYSRVRINHFETVKQELPTVSFNFRPFVLSQTGIVSENHFRLSYLDFQYSSHLEHVKSYASSRFEYRPLFYRPFKTRYFTFTPSIGNVSIFYGNSPEKNSQFLCLGFLGLDARTRLYRDYAGFKHAIEPYAFYRHYTYPTSSPNHHFIFDIDDGWFYMKRLTVGTRNTLYAKQGNSFSRFLFTDLYAHAFFNAHTFQTFIPKAYGKLAFFSLFTIRHYLHAAWDFEHNQLDHFNFRSEWTLNEDFALAAEFRHRDRFSWRKVDEDNFFLEVFRPQKELLHSPLSDRRDTLLLHFFYRFHPNWACELSSRQGWDRLKEPSYTEYEIDFLTTIQTAWHLRLSFQHTERDDRVALYVNVGLKPPSGESQTASSYYD